MHAKRSNKVLWEQKALQVEISLLSLQHFKSNVPALICDTFVNGKLIYERTQLISLALLM